MKDQGFAVAPGTHTLVGVQRTKVKKSKQKVLFQSRRIPAVGRNVFCFKIATDIEQRTCFRL